MTTSSDSSITPSLLVQRLKRSRLTIRVLLKGIGNCLNHFPADNTVRARLEHTVPIISSCTPPQFGFGESKRGLKDRALLIGYAIWKPKALHILLGELANGAPYNVFIMISCAVHY